MLAAILAAGLTVAGCGGGAVSGSGAASRSGAVSGGSAVSGARDPACAAALNAEQTLQARQGEDQSSESALDQDFMNFAGALSAAAQRETHAATARTMNALADDYTALVESHSGAAQLPDMSTVESDGAAFDRACAA